MFTLSALLFDNGLPNLPVIGTITVFGVQNSATTILSRFQ
jgi:hypothetical protein